MHTSILVTSHVVWTLTSSVSVCGVDGGGVGGGGGGGDGGGTNGGHKVHCSARAVLTIARSDKS